MPSITIGSTSYNYTSQARAIGGSLPNYFNPALSFSITEVSSSKWALRINRTDLVGLYDSRDYALGVLIGLYTSHSGHENSFSVWMNDSISNRGSAINSIADYTFSGTTNTSAFGGGSKDTNPTQSTTFTGLNFLEIRGEQTGADKERLIFNFDNNTNRDAFVTAIPDGSSFSITVGSDTFESVASITWTTFSGSGGSVAQVQEDDFASPQEFLETIPVGTTYNLEFTTP